MKAAAVLDFSQSGLRRSSGTDAAETSNRNASDWR